jgi:hypothetical protein
MTSRVEIPAYTDRWMMGDRFGEVLGSYVMQEGEHEGSEILRVKLDVSGRVARVVADDCRFI